MRVSFQSVEDAAMSSYQNLRAIVIDAVREYCAEHYFRPYIWVEVDSACRVPTEYVKDGMIILDIDDEAVRGFQMNDEYLSFEARFGDETDSMEIVVPLNRIVHVAAAEQAVEGASFMASPTSLELLEKLTGSSVAPRRPMRIK